MTSQVDQGYWANYTAIQHAKHELLQRYLGGWFPILSNFPGPILYIDCHAGRGRHAGGEAGSPLVALNTLLSHSKKDSILSKCQVRFKFIEQNPSHVENLQSELNRLGPLPTNVVAEIVNEDYESALRKAIDLGDFKATSFFFFDPFGFQLPIDLLRRILNQPRCELLITFMVRSRDMAIHLSAQESNMDFLFGTTDWRRLLAIEDPDERYGEMIRLFTERLGCAHSSVLEMRGAHREYKYALIHATNHKKGRELMKSAMWKVTPDGSFVIYQSHDPRQLTLITPTPDLKPLEDQLLATYAGCSVRYKSLEDWLLDLRWDKPHLNQVIRRLYESGEVEALEGSTRFVAKQNQLLRFSGSQG